MLANGTKLYYSTSSTKPTGTGTTDWTELPDLKEVPDIGAEPEKVENTGLNDANNQYENGIGDLGEMQYVFKYPANASAYATSAWKLARGWQANNTNVWFKEIMKDGFSTVYSAQVSVKKTGGSKNGVVDVQVSMSVTSDLDYTDPTV